VAAELKLDWHTVKALDQQYMEAQLKRVGSPGPQVIGVDEIAIRKGHSYRIVVSDLLRGRPMGARTARRRAWASFMPGSARRRARGFGLR
jgi:transposase